jgi:hypothetical protein
VQQPAGYKILYSKQRKQLGVALQWGAAGYKILYSKQRKQLGVALQWGAAGYKILYSKTALIVWGCIAVGCSRVQDIAQQDSANSLGLPCSGVQQSTRYDSVKTRALG